MAAGSSRTGIAVQWSDAQPATPLDGNKVTGYKLYAAKDQSNIYSLVYDGTGYPQIRSYTLTNLTPGSVWDFKVSASNFNGEGPASATALRTHSCLPPS